jgi:hypothetical protein
MCSDVSATDITHFNCAHLRRMAASLPRNFDGAFKARWRFPARPNADHRTHGMIPSDGLIFPSPTANLLQPALLCPYPWFISADL